MPDKKSDFIQYNKHGLRILLPKWMRIRQEGPNGFFADGKRGGLAVEIAQEETNSIGALRQSLQGNSDLSRRLIRESEFDSPIPGWAFIYEDTMRATGKKSFGWIQCLHPARDVFVTVMLDSGGQFTKEESLWATVFGSIKCSQSTLSAVPERKMKGKKSRANKISARPMTLVNAIEKVLAKGGKSKPGVRVASLKVSVSGAEPQIVTQTIRILNRIPRSSGQNLLVIRTDFSDEGTWKSICEAMQAGATEFLNTTAETQTLYDFVSNATYRKLSLTQLANSSRRRGHLYMFVVDKKTVDDSEHPILIVDFYHKRHRKFRLIPSEAWGISANLSIANMDFAEFADNVDPDGVFRGFPSG